MNPMLNASPASRWLPVSATTANSASTPVATSSPPARPGGEHLAPGAVQPLRALADDGVERLGDLVLDRCVGVAQLGSRALRPGDLLRFARVVRHPDLPVGRPGRPLLPPVVPRDVDGHTRTGRSARRQVVCPLPRTG